MNAASPMFTVLTPTYNRAALLPRLYESLRVQTFGEFEWLVIDDGSTDGTAELVANWMRHDVPKVRYIKQPNSGKHVAFNRGVQQARGQLIAEIDSDDELLPDALRDLWNAWNGIPPDERSRFVGATGLCVDDGGRIIGSRYPSDRFVSNSLESRYCHRIRGEKWGFQRRDVLLRYAFPELSGLTHVPEGIIWGKIAREFSTLYINVPLRIYHSTPAAGQITKAGVNQKTAVALLLQHEHVLNQELEYFRYAPGEFLRSGIHYGRACFHLRHSLRRQFEELQPRARAILLAALPVAWMIYHLDSRRSRENA